MNYRNTRLLLSLAVLSALAACGGQESKEQKPASAPTEASAVQTTLTLLRLPQQRRPKPPLTAMLLLKIKSCSNAHKASSNRCRVPKKCRNCARLLKNKSNSAINYDGMSHASPKAIP